MRFFYLIFEWYGTYNDVIKDHPYRFRWYVRWRCTEKITFNLSFAGKNNSSFSDSQEIISHGWPGLVSIHLEECGEVTSNGVSAFFNCKALEDLLLRHNGPGLQRNFILKAASEMPLLRKLSLDVCDASEGDFDIPDYANRYSLSTVKIARCKSQRCAFNLPAPPRRSVHVESLVLVWNCRDLTRTVVKERL